MPDTAWEEYCEASLDLSNQDDVGDPVEEPLDLDVVSNEGDYSMPAAVSRASSCSILAMASCSAAVSRGTSLDWSMPW